MSERDLPNELELIARYFAPLVRPFPDAYGLLAEYRIVLIGGDVSSTSGRSSSA